MFCSASANGVTLGVYSNGNGAWRSAGYNVNLNGWTFLVSVSQDTDCAANGGVDGLVEGGVLRQAFPGRHLEA